MNNNETLEHVVHPGGYGSGSEQNDNSNDDRASVDERIQELEQALQSARDDDAEKEELVEELQEALGAQEELVSDLQKRYRGVADELHRVKTEFSSVQKHNENLCVENEELIGDIHDVIQECDELKQQLEEKDARIMALQVYIEAEDETHNELLEDIERQREKEESSIVSHPFSPALGNDHAAAVAAAAIEERCEMLRCSLEGRIRHMNIEKMSLEEQLTDMKSKLSVAEDQIEVLDSERRRYKLQNDGLIQKMKTVYSRVEIQEELDRATESLAPISHPMRHKEEPTETSGRPSNTEATLSRIRRRASMATSSFVGGMKDATTSSIPINSRRSGTKDEILPASLHGCLPGTSSKHISHERGKEQTAQSGRRASKRRSSIWGTVGGGSGEKSNDVRGSVQSTSFSNLQPRQFCASNNNGVSNVDRDSTRISKNSQDVRVSGSGGGYLLSSINCDTHCETSFDDDDDDDEPIIRTSCKDKASSTATYRPFQLGEFDTSSPRGQEEIAPHSPPPSSKSGDIDRSMTFPEQRAPIDKSNRTGSTSNFISKTLICQGSLNSLNTIKFPGKVATGHSLSILADAKKETSDATVSVTTTESDKPSQIKGHSSRVLAQTKKIIQRPINSARKHVFCQRDEARKKATDDGKTSRNSDKFKSRPWRAVNARLSFTNTGVNGTTTETANEDQTSSTERRESDSSTLTSTCPVPPAESCDVVEHDATICCVGTKIDDDDEDEHDSVDLQVIVPRADVDLYEGFGHGQRRLEKKSPSSAHIKCLDTSTEQIIKPSTQGSELYEGFATKSKKRRAKAS